MPNILSINNYHYRRGGADVVYFDHAALMEELGWRNGFFSMKHPLNLETPWARFFVEEIEFGHAYSLPAKLAMATKVVYSFEARRKLRRLLDEFRPDVAHLHCIYHHLSPAILPVLSGAGVPVVMTAHDLKLACPAYKMFNRTGICERCRGGNFLNVVRYRCVRDSLAASAIVAVETGVHRLLGTYKKHLGKIVVPSRFFLQKFVQWGWPADALVHIPNFVDAGRFEPKFEPGSYFVYCGRLSVEKGVATLLRAAKAAGVSLKIVGTGPIEAELKAVQHDLRGNVEFLGYRSGAELHGLIRSARAVVLPSEWYENAPMNVLESFALGKPVIGARIGGIPELVADGQTGWTFTSGDADELADLLRRVAAEPDARIEQLGRSCRSLVETHFSRARYAESMLTLYSSLGVRN